VLINTDNRLVQRPSDYVTMTLLPDGYISFKKGKQNEIVISIASIYRSALIRASTFDVIKKKPRISRGLIQTEGK
jgi:hypothetical protein